MKEFWRGGSIGTAPLILNVGLCPFAPGNEPRFPLNVILGVPQRRSGRPREEKKSRFYRNSNTGSFSPESESHSK
jgi:hypothetical protein